MSKKIASIVRTYFKNVVWHMKNIFTRKESAKKAFEHVAKDSKKLTHAVKRAAHAKDREEALRYVKRGRMEYNQGRFEDAENEFRSAIMADGTYARAYLFLGHAMYKQGKAKQAIHYWERTIELSPKSEAADNARRKIAMADVQKDQVQSWINDRLGG